MTINEDEAQAVVDLIAVMKRFKNGNAIIFMVDELQKREILNGDRKFNKPYFKLLIKIEKKMKALVKEAEKISKSV